MKKNMMFSKLYARFLILFFSLAVCFLLFGTSSKAAPSQADIDNFNNIFYQHYNYYPNANLVNSILNYWDNNNNNYPYLFIRDWASGSNHYCAQVFMATVPRVSGNDYYLNSPNVANNNQSNYFSQASFDVSYTNRPGPYDVSESYYLYYDTFHEVDIDWNSPFYSANIPNPNMYVSYRNLSSTPVIDVPLNVSIASFPVGQNLTEYYIQMFALVNMDFNYFVQNTRDGIVYNGLDMEKWTTYFDVVTPQDYKKASDLSQDYIHLALTNGWYNNYPQDSSFNFSFADGIPSNLQSSAITKFHNFRKNATFADNTVYLYVRYFTIDEENNFVVGQWTVWKSYNPNEFYAELPSYYVPYNIVPGTQGINSNVTPVSTASPEPSVIVNPVNTNPGVNITVTQNVPNYPDYPTIASYNKDNLLVDTMNQLTSMEGFFGEFGSFLTTAFAFMPAWIWAIIGVGFSLSIVVMFLKIL